PGEKEALVEDRAILSNLNKLRELSETAYGMIYGAEGSCVEKMSAIISTLKEISSIDHGAGEIQTLLEAAMPLIEDASAALRSHKDTYDIDPERLDNLEERLELIRKLEKKYGEGIEAVLHYRDEAVNELETLEKINEEAGTCESRLSLLEERLADAARQLTDKRRRAAKKMEALIRNELMELAFGHPEFLIDIKPAGIAQHGADAVEFLFSANPGEQPKPLLKIASGGELSRVMLALKSVFAEYDNIPVLIFDEVDSGVGGKTAEHVGEKLRRLSSRHQVLCATHLPQIASMADFHVKVEKRERGSRVFVEVREVTGDDRLSEIARMLSGTITEVSLRHAKELLEKSRPGLKGDHEVNRTARVAGKGAGLFS
ncbi:MAG TPA: hypothetical protein VK435_11345, partial [Thermodesulfovibrionales bacterium]|nr:hypothetical protein [Thermodesulfovibrionales bacterium]